MGPLRKEQNEITANLRAIDRVKNLLKEMPDELTEVEEDLNKACRRLGPTISEAAHDYYASKRRIELLRELFGDSFFNLYERDNVANLRDKAQAEFDLRRKIWNDL